MSNRVRQRDGSDCGAACIASIAGHYGLHIPVARIRQYASTDQNGTTVLGLIQALVKLGFEAKGVKGTIENLHLIPTPCIAHLRIKNSLEHFVVIVKVKTKSIVIMDPSDGKVRSQSIVSFGECWTGVLVLMAPMATFEQGIQKLSSSQRLWLLLKPHSAALIQTIIGAAIFTAIGLTISIYVQKIVDYVLVEGNLGLLNLMSIGMIILSILQGSIGFIRSLLSLDTGQRIDAKLVLGYYAHLLKLPQSFFDRMRIGEIISRFNDVIKIRAFINEGLSGIAVNAFVLLLSFGLMFTIYWKLTVVVLVAIPLYALIYFITNVRNTKSERKVMERVAELESHLIESLGSIRTIRMFGLEPLANIKTESRFVSLLDSLYISGFNSVFSNSVSDLISRLLTIVSLWLGAGFVLDRNLTPGELLSFYALIAYFTGPVVSMIGIDKAIQNALIASDRLFEIMDLEAAADESKNEIPLHPKGKIVFKDVTFRYGTRVTVFRHFNLEIDQHQVTAIVGGSGSGKSTLLALLQNLYPLNDGQIWIGDFNLRYVSNRSLQRCFGAVSQRIDLFSGNVIENIVMSDPSPDMVRVTQICRELGILEFIEELPAGFETHLGENGAVLSGGQRQRIGIARALYKDPAILILDEPTSSLDNESEELVLRMTESLRSRGRTVILISHRLRTVVNANKIVVLKEGKIVEQGTHFELIERKDLYHRMWTQQFPEWRVPNEIFSSQ